MSAIMHSDHEQHRRCTHSQSVEQPLRDLQTQEDMGYSPVFEIHRTHTSQSNEEDLSPKVKKVSLDE